MPRPFVEGGGSGGGATISVAPGSPSVANVRIRSAHLDHDADFIVGSVRAYLNPAADRARFDWLYRRNPDGEARAWIAEDPSTGDPVGLAAAFPRQIYLRGQRQIGWVLGDFCIAEPYRTLGPALRLQRACLAGIGGGANAVFYDLPGAAMMPVYRRLGLSADGQIRRFAKPLRIDQRIRTRLVPAFLSGILSWAGNRLLALRDAGRCGAVAGLSVGVASGPSGEEFTALADRLGSRHGFCVRRSAEYLNWRFLEAPHRRYRLLTARRAGLLCGYAITERVAEVGWIVDLFATDDGAVPRALTAAAVTLFRAEGIATATASIFETHPWVTHLAGLGFRPREACPLVLGPDAPRPADVQARPWLVVQGDRES